MRALIYVLVCVTPILCQGSGTSDSDVPMAQDQECPLPQLLSGVMVQDVEETFLTSACDPSDQPTMECTINFAEGFVSYNGNTTNSIAIYTSVDAYCISGTRERVCEAGEWLNMVIFQKVATEDILLDWNLALLVIGVEAFVIADGIAAALGMMFFVRCEGTFDKNLAFVMLAVSIAMVLPVAGPVALITYCVVKKARKNLTMKIWYRILTIVSIILKSVGAVLWLVQVVYSATQDFYGEGPLRDVNGTCVPHEPNTTERRVQDALVIVTHVVSILVAIDWHVRARLVKVGTEKDDPNKRSSVI